MEIPALLRSALIGILSLAAFAPGLRAQLSVSLTPSVPPPSPVGTIVSWSTTVSGANPSSLWYRFRSRRIGSDFRIVRDYSPISTLDWTASGHEGDYEIQVSVRNTGTGDVAVASSTYRLTSLVSDTPVLSPTANPLVFLYSAPPCPLESRMRVEFQSPDGFVQYTPYMPCRRGLSMNFYLAGMRPNTSYSVHHTIDTGFAFQDGPELTLTTPAVSVPFPATSVTEAPPTPVTDGILLHSALFGPSFATDLYGNLVWFYSGNITFLTRPEPGGLFFGLVADRTPDASRQILREFDLAGTTIRETNAARINEQLAAMGKRAIGAFHHDALSLPDGKVMVLASDEQILTGVQGPGAVDVIGDMILVLDRDLQVVWTWDAFDHLDPHRAATLGETCGPQTSGCPPVYLASQANDWVHGNSLQFTSDGNILYSSRHQDWVIKIDYSDGEGSGDVLWRLGPGGDFQMNSADPHPWFSHQHDAQFAPADDSILTVYDDGNLRQAVDRSAHSRGQVLQLDEQNMVATLAVNADLGGFSFALGAAQQLPDGDYHFGAGWLPDNTCQSVEVDSSGNPVYGLKVQAPEFRSFRMRDLYTP